MNNSTRASSRWTQREEDQLRELVELKARVMREKRDPIVHLVTGMFHLRAGTSDPRSTVKSVLEISDVEWIVEWLVENADAIRDALAPFDSGVRPG
jgi:hypothetical protein